MVWRDIDIGAVSPGLSVDRAWDAMRPIVARPAVARVSYANESGHLNTSGRPYDDRHYFVIHYETAAHDDWKIDITFWLTDGPREQRARALAMRRLPHETRICILWLKACGIGCRHTPMKLAAPISTTPCLSTMSVHLMSSMRTCASAVCQRV